MVINQPTQKQNKAYIFKIVFACWGAAVGLFTLTAVLGLVIFGHETTDKYLFGYPGLFIIAYMLLTYPLMKQHLK